MSKYSTSHDDKLSKIMANEKFQDYLKLEYLKIGNNLPVAAEGRSIFPFNHPNWTATPYGCRGTDLFAEIFRFG